MLVLDEIAERLSHLDGEQLSKERARLESQHEAGQWTPQDAGRYYAVLSAQGSTAQRREERKMMNTQEVCCLNCRHRKRDLRCHLNPPQLHQGRPEWPYVRDQDSCGQFSVKEPQAKADDSRRVPA